MSTQANENDKRSQTPDSSAKTARGSKGVHSERDNSTEKGFKPKAGREEE